MSTTISSIADFVDITYSPEFRAVVLKGHDEYDDGTGLRDAVLTALH